MSFTSASNDTPAVSLRKIVDNTSTGGGGGGGGGGGAPTGPAGGVLAGTYPNPGYATQPVNTVNGKSGPSVTLVPSDIGAASSTGGFSWSDLFSIYPIVVPIRGFYGNYADFGGGNLTTSAYIQGNSVIIQGTVHLLSGDIAYDDLWFDLPNGFEGNNGNLASVALFTSSSGYHPSPGFLNLVINNSGASPQTAIVKYPGTVTTFIFSQFSTVFQKNSITSGGLKTNLGSGSTADNVAVIVPSTIPNNSSGVKVCFYFHGVGDDYISHISSVSGATGTATLMRGIVEALLADGWIIISSDGGAITNNYGNPPSNTASINALTWIKSIVNVTNVVCLGQSGGGLSSLRQAAQYSGISHWYGIYPLVNLAWSYTGSGNAFQAGLNTAYGSSDQASFTAASVGCDPLQFPLGQFSGKKFRMTASPSDTLVTKADNSDALATRITGTAASVVVVSTTGNHGDPSNFIPSDVITFFNS